MTSHLVAFSEDVDQATIAPINRVQDDILTQNSADRVQVPPEYNFIHWAAALGTNLTRAFIHAPSIEVRRMRPEIMPHERGGEVFTPSQIALYIPPAPIALLPTEDLELWASEDGAGATALKGLISLGPSQLPPPSGGDVRQIRLTGTTTLVADAWTTCPMTPELALDPGNYELIDFMPISATVVAARAILLGQTYRPGMPGIAGAEGVAREFDATPLARLSSYKMGTFDHRTVPQFQFFAAAADTTQTVIATVVKTG